MSRTADLGLAYSRCAEAAQELLRQWGRYLEDELTGVEAVVAHVVNHGPVDAPSAWIRGRQSPLQVAMQLEWVQEPHQCSRAGVSGVVKAFLEVNPADRLAWGRALTDANRARLEADGGVDVHAGIADLERYANEGR